ncbi:MAG TPA: hypothetical protein VFN79_01060 [Steroidobacteraceae bacterium]|nr:hypothetical protein [Steroidobacteraceae bacterium]
MNEIEIIRSQLALEHSHAAEVANACAAAFGDPDAPSRSGEAIAGFREACVSYLVWVLARFEERDQTLSELLAARRLGALAGQSGTSREVLARLEAALAAPDAAAARTGWQEFARYFNSAWTPRRQVLEAALAEHASVAQWRAVCAIDADSILEERNRYAQVTRHLPAGIELRQAPPAR